MAGKVMVKVETLIDLQDLVMENTNLEMVQVKREQIVLLWMKMVIQNNKTAGLIINNTLMAMKLMIQKLWALKIGGIIL